MPTSELVVSGFAGTETYEVSGKTLPSNLHANLI